MMPQSYCARGKRPQRFFEGESRLEKNTPADSDALQTVQAYFAAAGKQDAAALFATLAEDAVITVPASLPYGGTYTGTGGFTQALAGFASAWENSETTDLTLIADGAIVVALSRMTATARSSGRPIDTRIAEVFHLKEGKITQVQPYYQDTAALLDALTG